MSGWPKKLKPLGAAGALAVLCLSSCQSDSELPNAYWGMDGGVAGQTGQPCRNNSRCSNPQDVCIDEEQGDAVPPYCRTGCSTGAATDPCGVGLLCVGIADQGENGACLPVPVLGEECTSRCDDGLVCVSLALDGGTVSACATECDNDDDCTAPETCAGGGYCS